jgi:hypothetical protein
MQPRNGVVLIQPSVKRRICNGRPGTKTKGQRKVPARGKALIVQTKSSLMERTLIANRILLVDDDLSVRETLADVLEVVGYHIIRRRTQRRR